MADIHIDFARKSAEFMIEILEQLDISDMNENIVISPFSIQACMALVFAGVDVDTAKEIATALKYISDCPEEVAETFHHILKQYGDSDILKIANKIYVKEGAIIKAEYINVTKEKYQAGAEVIKFSDSKKAAEKINQWVADKTGGKIKDLIKSTTLNDLTQFVLLNALHFKGQWVQKFPHPKTMEGDFFAPGEQLRVKFMMKKAGFHYKKFDEFNFTALEMLYENCDLSMFVVLPNELMGLPDVLKSLKSINPLDLASQMQSTTVVVTFPKFKIKSDLSLIKVLKKMGVKKAFSLDADFSKMLDSTEPISVSEVLHQACIEVNETGTEAAAATAIAGNTRRTGLPNPQFKADHPFLYWIWNRKTILFVGVVVAPPCGD